MTDLAVDIGSVRLATPIMPASGTFLEDLADVIDLDALGAHVLKTITSGPRDGNPTPRVCEVDGSMLNSIGIPGKGAADFLKTIVPAFERYTPPLVVSISADTADAFATLCGQVSVPGVAAIEANISCPNIEADGRAFAMRPGTTYDAVQRMRQATDLPIWAKLSPNTGEIPEVAAAAAEAGADALVVANTVLAMSIDIRTRRARLGNGMGGLSGPALKPITLRMTYQAARATDLPVIGCGGIATLEDILEYLIAGARAVQVGTATFISPTAMTRLTGELRAYLAEQGLTSVRDLIGSVVDDAPAAPNLVEAGQ